jgi:hypothetical protein
LEQLSFFVRQRRGRRTDVIVDKPFSGAPSPPHAPRCAHALVQAPLAVSSPPESPNDATSRRLVTAMLHQCSLTFSTAYEPLPEAPSELRTKTYAHLSLEAGRRPQILQPPLSPLSTLSALSANAISLQANDAVARSPPGPDLPPNPYSRDSPPASETSRLVIDLSSPTKPSSRPSRKESHSDMSRPRLHKSARSEDEKRLVGDYA